MGSSQELRHALAKYALPSTHELPYLRAADPSASYRASSFRAQVDDLLQVIGRQPSPSATSRLAHVLHQVNDLLQSLPEQLVTQDALQLPALVLTHPVRRRALVLPFQRPSRVDVVGSYMVQSLAYNRHETSAYGPLTIDVAVEMPSRCFVPKDVRDFRYLDKRLLYLGVLVSEFEKSHDLVHAVALEAWRGDAAKAVATLTIEPSLVQWTEGGRPAPVVRIRLVPVLPSDVFPLSKLVPVRCNLKQEDANGTLGDGTPRPTPHYNNTILEDLYVRDHTQALHRVRKEAPHFAHACILAKVWLTQRELALAPDALNGFLISMLLLYLYETHRITVATPADQMLKILLHFLAQHPLEADPLVFPPVDGGVRVTPHGLATFQRAFDLVVLDASGRLNLFGRVSRSAWLEVQACAKACVHLLAKCTLETFQTLLLEKHSFWSRFDCYYWVPAPIPVSQAQEHTYTLEETRAITEMGLDHFWRRKLESILTTALTDRVQLVRARTHAHGEWSLHEDGPRARKVALGLTIDLANASRTVDKGPSADDPDASAAFRRFWRGKAELRRFQDGSILEAVVWDGGGPSVLDTIVKYIVPAHCPAIAASAITTSTSVVSRVHEATTSSFDDATKLWPRFHALAKHLRALDALPLKVSDVVPVHAAFRNTSNFPVPPHPLAYSKRETIDAPPVSHVSTVLEPLEVHVTFERSSAWPNDRTALLHAKTAFYVHLGHQLETQAHLRCDVATDGVDVFLSGYVFRLLIVSEKDKRILTGRTHDVALMHTPEYRSIKCTTTYRAAHARRVHALQTRHAAYGPTVRLVQHWLADKVLGNVLRLEALELVVAKVFLSPIATPHTVFAAFGRVLKQLASTPWHLGPLMIDFDASMDDTQRREITKRFEASTSCPATHPAMFLAAAYEDVACLSSWTREKPDKVVLARLVALAQQSYDALVAWVAAGARPRGWTRAFESSTREFDLTLHLCPDKLPLKWTIGPRDKTHAYVAPVYKNTIESTRVPLLIGFDPVHDLLVALERAFGHVAYFFVQGLPPSAIFVTWKPHAFVPTKFRALTASYQVALRVDATRCVSVPNIFEILSDMQRMGKGIIERIESSGTLGGTQ
ncbi:hypothetical protein PsorP6_006546 [Peronosclerospora sorghi]|uniref:Uncharacterized protein n=1 Tax=Peronosclerospora sorghi TaxID=230839 RepID=A0ACC0W4K2_9STRA|nr:hypothetical protein PsorP6_006546 [Peronosclerospora sorghi]